MIFHVNCLQFTRNVMPYFLCVIIMIIIYIIMIMIMIVVIIIMVIRMWSVTILVSTQRVKY